jgi:DNA adenine methylase
MTSSFVSYSKDDFNDEDQSELALLTKHLDEKNVKFLLSNSDPKNTMPDDEYFDDLYNGFKIERVRANRSINSDIEKRGEITEIMVRNY